MLTGNAITSTAAMVGCVVGLIFRAVSDIRAGARHPG
jgi:hypothetical protein